MALPILKPTFKRERVWLTGIRRSGQTARDFEASTQELSRLIDTAGGVIVGQTRQKIDTPVPKTFLGKGKVEEILGVIQQQGVDTVAIDDELTPTQNQNLEKAWNVKVLDRTAVILDIFAKRAHTKEGRLQVELAQLEYIQPRLKGMWSHFSQQTGGIGTRGPGETQLEVDRRRLRERIAMLKGRLEGVKTHRRIQRQKREAVSLPVLSIVGYTNAGKSTLFNALTKAHSFVEDKLFATLDPMVRRLRLPGGKQVLLADTVGFIRKLPHTLVEAFQATFEEVAFSDGLIHVVDVSDPEALAHVETVEEVLLELNLNHKPCLTVFNKVDFYGQARGNLPSEQREREGEALSDSASAKSGRMLRGPRTNGGLDPRFCGVEGGKSKLSFDAQQNRQVLRSQMTRAPIIEAGESRLNGTPGIGVSALTGAGLDALTLAIEKLLRRETQRITLFFPHDRGDLLGRIHALGHVVEVQHLAKGARVVCDLAPVFLERFAPYLAKNGHSR